MRDSTLSTWCSDNGVAPQHARLTLLGGWNGPKGVALRERILVAAGLIEKAAEPTADFALAIELSGINDDLAILRARIAKEHVPTWVADELEALNARTWKLAVLHARPSAAATGAAS